MKSKHEPNELITFIPAVLLIMLWAYAAVSKIAEYDRFVQQMKLVPLPLMALVGPTLGWLVPLAELVLICLLLKDNYRIMGLWLSFILLFVFEIYISAMLMSGVELPCTCGGLISKLQWKEHLIFNAVFIVITMFPTLYKWIRNGFYQQHIHRGVYK